MGVSNFSPIPDLRPSHCPSPRISNAASPRQVILYRNIIHPTQTFRCIISVEIQRCEV